MGWYEIPNEQEDAHDNVFRDGDNVGSRYFQDLNSMFNGSVQVNVIRADPSGDTKLQVLGLDNVEYPKCKTPNRLVPFE